MTVTIVEITVVKTGKIPAVVPVLVVKTAVVEAGIVSVANVAIPVYVVVYPVKRIAVRALKVQTHL